MDLKKYIIFQPLIFSLFLAAGLLVGYKMAQSGDKRLIRVNERNKMLQPAYIDNVMRLIESQYLFNPDYDQITNDILDAIAKNLDQYSAYIPPGQLSYVTDKLNAIYSGLGIITINYNDSLLITEVIKNSPADKAGIMTLEKIIMLNNKDITDLDPDKMADEFDLSMENEISLVISGRDYARRTVKLKSESFEIPTIRSYYFDTESILYLQLMRFSNHTFREFMDLVEKYSVSNQLQNLIIDVRDNPGGYLQEVVKILDQLFDKSGITLVETAYRDGRRDVIKTTGRNFFDIKNIAVLINENSISGSEVLAGSLQDLDRAVIIGKRSFGKGLVQDQYDLFNGGAMRLTVANYYLPSGRSIQKKLKIPGTTGKDFFYTELDTFFSLGANRRLFSGGGIEPDLIVLDSIYEQAALFLNAASHSIIRMLADLVFSNPELMSIPQESYEVYDIFRDDIENFMDLHDFMEREALLVMLRAKLAFLLYGPEMQTEIMVKSDPWIIQAVRNKSLN